MQAAFTDRTNLQPKELFQLTEIKIRIDILLSQLENIYHQGTTPLASLNTISYCDLCGAKYRMLINEVSGRTNYSIKGNIFCPECDLAEETPFYLFSAVISNEGQIVHCHCTQCKQCTEISVESYNGTPLCLKCIIKHNLKDEISAVIATPKFE